VREGLLTFTDGEVLERRRSELLARRRQHGYQFTVTLAEDATAVARIVASESRPVRRRALCANQLPLAPALPAPARGPVPSPSPAAQAHALERDILEAHGLPLSERAVQQLVAR
jgi:hypothetical protein